MSPRAPIPPSPRAACAGSRRALGDGQPRDGISDRVRAASARRLPRDELPPPPAGRGAASPPGLPEQVRAPACPSRQEKAGVAAGGSLARGWGALLRKFLVCSAMEQGSSSCSRGPTASPPCSLHGGWRNSPSRPIRTLTLGHGQPSSCWLPAPPPWCSLAHQEHLSYPWRGDRLLFQPRPLVLTQRCMAGFRWSGTLGQQQLSFPRGAGSDE